MNTLFPILAIVLIGYGAFMLRYAFRHPETSSTLPEDMPIAGKVVSADSQPTVVLPQVGRQKSKPAKRPGKRPKSPKKKLRKK